MDRKVDGHRASRWMGDSSWVSGREEGLLNGSYGWALEVAGWLYDRWVLA